MHWLSNPVEILGFIAGGLVSISLLPQVIKSWRTRSTKDIALSWTLINVLGQVFWIIYGLRIQSDSLVIMSGITLIMTCLLIVLKIVNG